MLGLCVIFIFLRGQTKFSQDLFHLNITGGFKKKKVKNKINPLILFFQMKDFSFQFNFN